MIVLVKRAASAVREQDVGRSGVDPTAFNFDYRISGDRASWRPLRAFDDGRQTFIEFPPSLAQGEAPPHWRDVIVRALASQREALTLVWRERDARAGAGDEGQRLVAAALEPIVSSAAADALRALYPQAAGALSDDVAAVGESSQSIGPAPR